MDGRSEVPPPSAHGRGRRVLGRRGFVTALFAGTAVSAAAAGRALAGGPVVAAGHEAPAGTTVLTGAGIDPSGAHDSTAGLQGLIDSSPEGAALWLPAGLYLVDGLVLRAGQSLAGPPAGSYLGDARGGARVQARTSGGTTPVLVVGEFGQVADISVAGSGRTRPVVRPGGFGAVLRRVTMREGSVGFDAGYVSGSLLSGCRLHENVTGIANPVDSTIEACVINANSGNGVSLGAGANDNVLAGNKIEWNDGHGIDAYRAEHTVVIGGIVDRNGSTGIRFVDCSHSSVVGGVLRRNGRLAKDAPDDDCHVYLQNCTGVVITGISTDSGADDDGGGRPSPGVAIATDGGSGVTIVGNDLAGRTTATAIANRAPGTRDTRVLNGGVAGVQHASGTRVRIGAEELELATGASGTVAFELDDPGDQGTSYRLLLVSLDHRTGARGLGETWLLVGRDGGGATVAMSAVEDRIGDGFAAAGGRYRVRASTSADGSRLTITVDNAGGAPARIALELT